MQKSRIYLLKIEKMENVDIEENTEFKIMHLCISENSIVSKQYL